MDIHVYMNKKGSIWAVNEAVTEVVFAMGKGALQRRVLKGRRKLAAVTGDKLKIGFGYIGPLSVPVGDAFGMWNALMDFREVFIGGIDSLVTPRQGVLVRPGIADFIEQIAVLDPDSFFPCGDVRLRISNIKADAIKWLISHRSLPPADIAPIPVTLLGGKGCYF